MKTIARTSGLFSAVSAASILAALSGVGCSSAPSDEGAASTDETSGETNDSVAQDLGAGQGLTGEYFDDVKLGHKVLTRTDADVDFTWSDASPSKSVPRTNFSVRWTGYIQATHSETYTFVTDSDDGVRLWVNGDELIDDWTAHAVKQNAGTITLKAGQRVPIELEYYQATGGARVSLIWSSAHQARQVIPATALYTAPASTCPAAAAKGGAALFANLDACGWPGPKSTGPKTTSLKVVGPTVISTKNAVFENAIVNGCLVVDATNVTIRNVRVNFVPGGANCSSNAGRAAINLAEGSTATVTDTEVDGNGQVHIGIRNAGQGANLTRVNVHDVEDGVYANLPEESRALHPTAGSNTIITDSWFHDFVPRSFNNKTMADSSRANGHMDGVQTDGGANNTQLIHNTFQMSVGAYTARYTSGSTVAPSGQSNGFIDSATAFWNGGDRSLGNVVVRSNLFAAQGGFVHYAFDRPDTTGTVTHLQFVDNRYSTVYNECIGLYGVWFNGGTPTGGWSASGNVRSGNEVIENGQSVDADATPLRANKSHCN